MNKEKSLIDVPVLLMLFNRADTTRKVFDRVREARPSKLFIAANGPRPDVPDDIHKCQAVKDIFKDIDWECEVHTKYPEVNIGMQPHWRLALDWFFEHVESGIVLEDDCVADPSFFNFCKELLEKYKDVENILCINGSNFQFGCMRGDATYYFSKYPHTWGWATWKRAWHKYDNGISSFPEFKRNKIIDTIVTSRHERDYWIKFFEKLYSGEYDGCDVKWLYSIWSNAGLVLTPNVNMITNIGFGADAGHTFFKERTLDQQAHAISVITHPSGIPVQNKEADAHTFKICFHRSFFQKAFYVSALRVLKFFKKHR